MTLPKRMISARPAVAALLAAGLVPSVLSGAVMPEPSFAQARLDAQYEARLAGIPIGRGGWTINIGDKAYSAAAYGGTIGLLKLIANGSGTSAAQGRVVKGALVATNYAASTTTYKKTVHVHMVLADGDVKTSAIEPTPHPDPKRIPVTAAHRRGVFDPMTASLLHVPGTGNPLTPAACNAATPIFDGRMRYNLNLSYKRMETVKAREGYHGPAVVCAIYFVPVSGYIPDRPVIKYLAAQRHMEIAFAPIAGTRFLVPFRIVVPTPFGTAELEATKFITEANATTSGKSARAARTKVETR